MTAPATTFKALLDPIGVDEFFDHYYDRNRFTFPEARRRSRGLLLG